MTMLIFVKKVITNNLRPISKQYAHLQTMTYSLVKLRKIQIKTLGEVLYT